MNMQDTTRVNRKHKDRLFRFIFKQKKELLSLYNAINDSNYDDPEALEIYTMEDYVYMGMKNDLSFLIDWTLNVFEHQSTYNPNMSLRGLFYVSASLKKFVDVNHLDVFSSKRLMIPIPRYYVFYNGTDEIEDVVKLYLTDSMPGKDAVSQSCVQFVAHMININAGRNSELMEKCPKLYEYSLFVAEVRKNTKSGMELKEAIEYAVERCIRNGILEDILRGNRAEVTDMLMKEYDEALHIANEKEISFEEGFLKGQLAERENTERVQKEAEQKMERVQKETEQKMERVQKETEQKMERAQKEIQQANLKIQILTYQLQGKTLEEISELVQLPMEQLRDF